MVDRFETANKAQAGYVKHYEECGGLMIIIDSVTGLEVINESIDVRDFKFPQLGLGVRRREVGVGAPKARAKR